MRKLFRSLMVGALLATPIAGLAAIDSTHHDMPYYLTAAVEREKCAVCHAVSLPDIADPGLGQVGVFCVVVCHQGSGGKALNAFVTAPGYMNNLDLTTTTSTGAFGALARSHGFVPTLMPAPDAAGDVTLTNWPHTNEPEMQCTSCHSVHDGANPPFLNAPLGTGDPTTAFCVKCHTSSGKGTGTGRVQAITAPGAHPTEFGLQLDGTAALDNGRTTAGGRAMGFKAAGIQVGLGGGVNTEATFNARLSAAGGNSWQLGGHFLTATTDGVPAGAAANNLIMGCYSCHSAHQEVGGPSLTMGSRNGARTSGASSVICVACHVATPGDIQNTVMWNAGTTSYGHPANEAAALPYNHDHASHGNVHANIPDAGNFPLDVANIAAINAGDGVTTADVGANGEVLCVTCHDVHQGVAGEMAIRLIDNFDGTGRVCSECHKGVVQGTEPAFNRHHPVEAAANFTGYPSGNLKWANGNAEITLTDGLGCSDCHIFGNTAHNW